MRHWIVLLLFVVLAPHAFGRTKVPDYGISVTSNASWEVLSTEETLDEVILTLDGQVHANETNDTAMAADIATNESNITVNAASIASNAVNISANGVALGITTGQVAQVLIDLGITSNSVVVNAGSIASNLIAIGANAALAESNTLAIAANLASNGVNAVAITTIQGALDVLYSSSIEGMNALYTSWGTSNIVIETGWGYCGMDFFHMTADQTNTLPSACFPVLASNVVDYAYVYIDASESTFPTNIVFTNTLTEPVYDSSYLNAMGWYNGDDRLVAAIRIADWSTSGSEVIVPFVQSGGDYLVAVADTQAGRWADLPIRIQSGGTATNVPAATQYDAADYLPVNASHAWCYITGTHSGAGTSVSLFPYELTESYTSSGALISGNGYANSVGCGMLPLGDSRNISFSGENDDDDAITVYLYGWRIER